jgi:hypothetical protein
LEGNHSLAIDMDWCRAYLVFSINHTKLSCTWGWTPFSIKLVKKKASYSQYSDLLAWWRTEHRCPKNFTFFTVVKYSYWHLILDDCPFKVLFNIL